MSDVFARLALSSCVALFAILATVIAASDGWGGTKPMKNWTGWSWAGIATIAAMAASTIGAIWTAKS